MMTTQRFLFVLSQCAGGCFLSKAYAGIKRSKTVVTSYFHTVPR